MDHKSPTTQSNGAENTEKVLRVPAKLIDSTVQSLADGKFDGLREFPNYIDDLISISDGADGIKQIADESVGMSREAKYGVAPAMENEMPNVPAEDREDIALGLSGLASIARIFFRRGRKQGVAEGRAQLVAELKAGTVSVESL